MAAIDRRIPRRPKATLPPRNRLSAAIRALLVHDAGRRDLPARSLLRREDPAVRSDPGRPAGRGNALQALLVSALALPGMVGGARAALDDVVAGNTAVAHIQLGPDLDVTSDEAQEIGIQYSHYREGARNLYGPVTTGVIPAAPGSPVTGTTTGIGNLPQVAPIRADGEHAYARFRIGDRARLGFDFAQDIWSGASATATLPSSIATVAGATINALSAYFDTTGKPLFQAQYQANANPNTPGGTPQKLVYRRDTTVGHVIGYASPETRRQTTFKYGYDWDETAIDAGAGVSSEVDFLSKFANVSLKRDFDEKRTTINLGRVTRTATPTPSGMPTAVPAASRSTPTPVHSPSSMSRARWSRRAVPCA